MFVLHLTLEFLSAAFHLFPEALLFCVLVKFPLFQGLYGGPEALLVLPLKLSLPDVVIALLLEHFLFSLLQVVENGIGIEAFVDLETCGAFHVHEGPQELIALLPDAFYALQIIHVVE